MRLARFGPAGSERPALALADGTRRDVSAYFRDFDHRFFAQNGMQKLRRIAHEDVATLPEVPADERWGACIARPGKILCIGLNYHDHAKESGMEPPQEPILFMKGTNTMVGPYDDILIPRGSKKTDWEVELGVVIGKNARYLGTPDDSANHIAGYCISHDVSERAYQIERGGQWTKGKSCDTFNPVGPYLVTPDEAGDVNTLELRLSVNGEEKQHSTTSQMIFKCHFLVHYLSQFMTLEAGDLITTGTPPGVGMGLKPQQFLKAGDVVDLSITNLGEMRNTCKDA